MAHIQLKSDTLGQLILAHCHTPPPLNPPPSNTRQLPFPNQYPLEGSPTAEDY